MKKVMAFDSAFFEKKCETTSERERVSERVTETHQQSKMSGWSSPSPFDYD